MNHSFNIDVAKDVGVVPAVILEHIAFWTLKNESNGTAFQDGKHWTFSTAEGFQKYFPYLSAKQIRDAIKKLSDKGYLITGCFNSKPMDRTKWYSLGEKADELYRLSIEKNPSVELTKKSNASDEKVKCILQNGQMHLTKKSNALYKEKDIEKDIEEDKPPTPKGESRLDEVEEVFNHWKTVMNSPRSRLDKKRKKTIQDALELYSVAELCEAIDGCALHDWSMGRNDNRTKYNGIGVILRDAEHIDKFVAIFKEKTKRQAKFAIGDPWDFGESREKEIPINDTDTLLLGREAVCEYDNALWS